MGEILDYELHGWERSSTSYQSLQLAHHHTHQVSYKWSQHHMLFTSVSSSMAQIPSVSSASIVNALLSPIQ